MNISSTSPERAFHLLSAIEARLIRMEEELRRLGHQQMTRDFYSTRDFARVVDRDEFTVREWCRHGRIRAQKRPCGRGQAKEWMIPHVELVRYQSEGLLPLPKHGG